MKAGYLTVSHYVCSFLWSFTLVGAWLAPACADVFQWEYVDPAQPELGKRQSSTLAPDGAGAHFENQLGLAQRDLTKAYLRGVSISQYRVSGTIFNDAYLADANMFNLQGDGMSARGADMSRANLQRARLTGADLSLASFVAANLSDSWLGNAWFTGANFTDANIYGARLGTTTSRGFSASQLYSTASYQAGDLGPIELDGNDVRNWDFAGLKLQRASFSSGQVAGANFANAEIKDARFTASDLSAAQLYATASYKSGDLGAIQLFQMNLSGWDFSGQSLVEADFVRSELSHADFSGADLSGATLGEQFKTYQSVNFAGARLRNLRPESSTTFKNANFDAADLTGARLSQLQFIDSSFADAVIAGAELTHATERGFTLANLYSTASYKQGELAGIDLSHSQLPGFAFVGGDATGAKFTSTQLSSGDFRRAKLAGASLSAAGLVNADFREADLSGAHLDRAVVDGAKFNGANLDGAFFGDADLTGADLTDATIKGAKFYNASGAKWTKEQLYSTASYKHGDLGAVNLSGDMRSWDFRDQDLTGARFERDSRLEGAWWSGATLGGALFFVNALQGADFTAADVRGVRFSASDLSGADFRQADLTDADFSETKLVGARLGGASMDGASMVHCDLANASLVGADLRGARFTFSKFNNTDLTDADIRGANLEYVTQYGFTFANLQSTRSYQERVLTGINFEGNNFAGRDLGGLDFTDSDFNRVDLRGTSLAQANMTRVNFQYAQLAGTDFTEAVIAGISLPSGTSYGFTREQLYSTRSYREHDLRGVNLNGSQFTDWDFSGVDLRGANLAGAILTGGDFTGAKIQGADFSNSAAVGITAQQLYSTASYQQQNLAGARFAGNLANGWDLTGQDLTGVSFADARLQSAKFSAAVIRGANFANTTSRGFTAQQLYATASYQQLDLRGVNLGGNSLEGWNFSDQNLQHAIFIARGGVTGSGNFARADLRGAQLDPGFSARSQKNNAILPTGVVAGLALAANQTMHIRNYHAPGGSSPIPIVVQSGFDVREGSTLRLTLDGLDWNSTISFAAGIQVKLNGVLELLFAEDVNVRDQVGRSWKIFDWAGVSPAGRFALESDPRLQWGLGRLYSDGVVELAAIVPEPMSMPLLLMAAGGVAGTCRQRRRVRPLERQRLV